MAVIALDYARARRRRWPIVLAIFLSLSSTTAVAWVKGPEWRDRYTVWVAERQAIAAGRAAAEVDWETGSPGSMAASGFWMCGGVIGEGDIRVAYDEKTGLPSRTYGNPSSFSLTASNCDGLYADAYNERVAELWERHGPPANYVKDPGKWAEAVADLVEVAEWTPVAAANVPETLYIDEGDTVTTAPVPNAPRLCMYRVSRIVEARGGLLVHTHSIHVKATGDRVLTLY